MKRTVWKLCRVRKDGSTWSYCVENLLLSPLVKYEIGAMSRSDHGPLFAFSVLETAVKWWKQDALFQVYSCVPVGYTNASYTRMEQGYSCGVTLFECEAELSTLDGQVMRILPWYACHHIPRVVDFWQDAMFEQAGPGERQTLPQDTVLCDWIKPLRVLLSPDDAQGPSRSAGGVANYEEIAYRRAS